jgi:hypothetical protein
LRKKEGPLPKRSGSLENSYHLFSKLFNFSAR